MFRALITLVEGKVSEQSGAKSDASWVACSSESKKRRTIVCTGLPRLVSCCKMAQINLEPPSFVCETKSYAEYKEDLQRWSRLTENSIGKKHQADMVIYRLDGHPSGIKEKITTQIGTTLVGKDDGVDQLIKFLDAIYLKDDMVDAWERFKEFSSFVRKQGQSIVEFIPDWENCHHRLKTVGCEYPDTVLGFKLLEDAKLQEMETKLVLTGVSYEEVKTKKNLKDQVVNSLKKFTGRAALTGGNSSSSSSSAVGVKVEPTWVSEMEEVLLAKAKGARQKELGEGPGVLHLQERKNQNIKVRRTILVGMGSR